MSKKRDVEARQILQRLDLPHGDKEVAMLQHAQSLNRLNDKQGARRLFQDALSAIHSSDNVKFSDSEIKYLKNYAELYLCYLRNTKIKPDLVKANEHLDVLLSLEVRDELKNRLLPLPTRNSLG